MKTNPLRRIMLASATTVSAVVALLALKPHAVPAPTVAAPAARARTGQVAPSTSPAPGSSSPATSGQTSKTQGTKTYTGDTASTPFGDVQVVVTISGGKITAVKAPQTPDSDRRSRSISSWSVPQLNQEALSAQSANIDTVSGASYTSEGYRESLQSALDQAGFR